MNEKKKNQSIINTGTLSFILFWTVIIGFLQSQFWDYSDLARGAYDFVMYKLPVFLHRLWVAYLLHGIIIGLALGLAQKFAIQSLRPLRLQYWIRTTILFTVGVKLLDYINYRFIMPFANSDNYSTLYWLLPALSQILLLFVPWWFLRKHFKHAWLWLLLAIPNLAFAATSSLYPFGAVLQAVTASCVLLYLNQQNPTVPKIKGSSSATERLDESLDENEEEEQLSDDQTLVQSSEI